ncbi:hypothetical protein Tco_1555350 [Tanacetum coccineum]
MTSPYPTPPFTVPSPSESSFSIPTTSEPVFSVATTEPVFESQTSHSAQPSQNTQPQFQQYNSTTVSSSNAKFPYLKKDDRKRTGRDPRGNIMILPPVTMEEQIAVQRETKARTILLQSLLEDHMADFHHLDDAKDIWLAVKARFGGNEESKKMRKSMLKQEFADFKISESEGLHKDKFLRSFTTFMVHKVAITLKTKGGLDFLSFDDLYNKLRTLEIDVKGGSSYDSRVPAAPTHSAFISAASTNSKWSTADSKCQPSSVMIHNNRSLMKTCDQLQVGLEEQDIKWQMAMLSDRIIDLKRRRRKSSLIQDAARFDTKRRSGAINVQSWDILQENVQGRRWIQRQGYGDDAGILADGVSVAAGVGADGISVTSSDATDAETQFALMGLSPQVQSCPFGCNYIYTELKKDFDNLEVQYKECFIQVQAYKSSLQNLEQQKSWYQNNQLALEEKIRILTADLGNTTNMLKYTEKLNEQAKIDNMNNKVKLEESEARFDKWMDSSKNLNKLINSSMSTRSKFGLGYGDTFGSDEVFDLSAPSIFDSCLKDAIEKPLYDGFVKAGGLHAVPGPITGTFMPPSNKPDIDDTQYTYGSKSNNCVETNSVSNDFVSCDNSDKSSNSETTGFVTFENFRIFKITILPL